MHYLQQVDPEDTGVLTRLGNMFLRSGMPAEALEVYGKILALEPDNHVAWFNSAHSLIKLGGYAGAVESLHKALEGDPSNAAARHMLAVSPLALPLLLYCSCDINTHLSSFPDSAV